MDAGRRDVGVAGSRGAVERVGQRDFEHVELVSSHRRGAQLLRGERHGDDALAAAEDSFGLGVEGAAE